MIHRLPTMGTASLRHQSGAVDWKAAILSVPHDAILAQNTIFLRPTLLHEEQSSTLLNLRPHVLSGAGAE